MVRQIRAALAVLYRDAPSPAKPRTRDRARINRRLPLATRLPPRERWLVVATPIGGSLSNRVNVGTLIASHLQRIAIMKTATFPSLRVEAELREAAESVLREGETLTSLIETAMRETIHRRRVQAEFLARGLQSSEDAKRTGVYHPAAAVHGELQRRLDARRKQVLG